jgi:hypothetical protein
MHRSATSTYPETTPSPTGTRTNWSMDRAPMVDPRGDSSSGDLRTLNAKTLS